MAVTESRKGEDMTVNATESEDKSEVTIHVAGRFDFSCHQEFMTVYMGFPKGEKQFVVDLENTEYMDSSAMGMLLQLRDHSKNGNAVSLTNPNEGVSEILHIAQFDKLFKIS
jgi:anti-anti-sigma factor